MTLQSRVCFKNKRLYAIRHVPDQSFSRTLLINETIVILRIRQANFRLRENRLSGVVFALKLYAIRQ